MNKNIYEACETCDQIVGSQWSDCAQQQTINKQKGQELPMSFFCDFRGILYMFVNRLQKDLNIKEVQDDLVSPLSFNNRF